MAGEQEKTVAALKYAIQMEIDGKEYYLKASEQSRNPMGQKLLKNLAAEEDIHRQRFQEIYAALQAKKAWPAVTYKGDAGKALRTIFAQESARLKNAAKGSKTELEAVQGAISMEVKSYNYYQKHGKEAAFPAEKEYFNALAAQERQHQMLLLDYYEFLKDPAAYFVTKEHPNLDAG
ncbi:MAG: ferritin family protein [Chloroflexota bacterium]